MNVTTGQLRQQGYYTSWVLIRLWLGVTWRGILAKN